MVAQSDTALLNIAPDRWAVLPPTARTALLRSQLYRAFGGSLLFPEEASWSKVIALFSDVASHGDELATHAQTIASLESLLSPCSMPVAQLQRDFDSIFGHTISAECPPYETQYGAGIIFAQAQRMGDITAFYRAFGVRVSDDAHERPDHIAVELEFLGTLAFREALSIIECQDQHGDAVRDAQRKFLTDHLGPWCFSFAERLRRKADAVRSQDHGVYGTLATCLSAFMRDEMAHVGISVDSLGLIEPTKFDFEPEGCTFQCGPAGEPILANLPGFQV